jgi:hypothetical protein
MKQYETEIRNKMRNSHFNARVETSGVLPVAARQEKRGVTL